MRIFSEKEAAIDEFTNVSFGNWECTQDKKTHSRRSGEQSNIEHPSTYYVQFLVIGSTQALAQRILHWPGKTEDDSQKTSLSLFPK